IPNLVVAKVGANGKIALSNNSGGSVHLIADVAGYHLLEDLAPKPPAPVTGVSAAAAQTSVALSWTNPTTASFTGVMIRRAAGATAPSSPTTGTLVADVAKPGTSFRDTGLTVGTQYS